MSYKAITVAAFVALGTLTFAAASSGTGAKDIKDKSSIAAIKKECPDYYQNKDGECLRKNFRSAYVIWHRSGSSSGGSSGSGGGK